MPPMFSNTVALEALPTTSFARPGAGPIDRAGPVHADVAVACASRVLEQGLQPRV
ncbi:Uncharacterised protein [Corynebacterium jeikeium]|nr:Uncharacterised protein [Corynebacterium jeikeium]